MLLVAVLDGSLHHIKQAKRVDEETPVQPIDEVVVDAKVQHLASVQAVARDRLLKSRFHHNAWYVEVFSVR